MISRMTGAAAALCAMMAFGCAESTTAPRHQAPSVARFDEGNPPPPPISLGDAATCTNPNEPCDEKVVACPLAPGECFKVRSVSAQLFRNPPSTYASLEFRDSNAGMTDGALIRETRTWLTSEGSLKVRFEGIWYTIDMTSVRGSLLGTAPNRHRVVRIEANAYLPNGGGLYSRRFLMEADLENPFDF
jgi:hypothetical protein